MRWHGSLGSRTWLGIEVRIATGCIDQEFHHGDGRREASVDKKKHHVYEIHQSMLQLSICFMSISSRPLSNMVLVQISFIVLQSTQSQAKSAYVRTYAAGGTGSCRWACLLCYTSALQPAVPGQHHRVLMPARPIADIRRVAQASRAQHCRLSDSRARNLSSSTRASAAKRAPPPAPSQTPSTTNRLCPCN